jgi:2-methylcitrate dehydratase PrpD
MNQSTQNNQSGQSSQSSQSSLREQAGLGVQHLIDWAVKQELTDIPVEVRQQTVMVIADDLAAMLSAESEPQVINSHSMMVANGPLGQASVMRRDRAQLAPLQAALANALAASWNELDEGYRKAVCHAGLYTLPILLAISESEGIAFSEVLRAATLAYEVTARFAKTWRFSALTIHPHALFNAVGAAAAVGFLRRLPSTQMRQAICNASTLGVVGPYSQAVRGSLIRNAWAAAGISNGLQAIDWALAGVTSLAETPHDVYHETLHSEAHIEDLTQGLGTDWAVSSGYHKINACCQYAHSSIEAMREILDKHPHLQGGTGVAQIELQTHRLGMTLTDKQPVTTLGAKFSMPHALAASLVYGHGGAEAFSTQSMQDERVARLRRSVAMRLVDEELAWPHDRPAFVTLVTEEGQRYSANCMSARGGPDRPFTDDELWQKIGELSSASAPGLTQTMQALHALCARNTDDNENHKGWAITWHDVVNQMFQPSA